ncbi:MAG: UvrD-helicase domain-containing protein, partial [Chloroflexota bacterium]
MQPIVAQVSPNDEQRPAVLDRGRDVVVTAGAGTGKTRTLVARYLSLLAEGVPLRAIVAITFTRKAAREMRNRIRAELQTFLAGADLSGAERQRWDALYGQLDAARIGTIHNLCTEILRAHPAEMSLDPRFDVLDEGQGGLLRQESVDEALAWAADDAQAVLLFSFLGERRLRSLLESLMGQRLEAAAAFDGLPEPLWPQWQAKIVAPIKAFVDDPALMTMFSDLAALKADGTLSRAAARGDKLARPLATLLDLWSQIQAARKRGDWPGVAACLRPLRANMKQVGRKDNWSPAEPKVIIKELQKLYDENVAGFVGKEGINLSLDQQMAGLMPVLGQLFERANDAYLARKRVAGALDFDDLEALALELLQNHPAARQRWQNEVAAILVDEFQDTNSRQRDLVKLINGERGKLFIVGDAKQSIYRFRGAEVTVFREERAKIEDGGGAS